MTVDGDRPEADAAPSAGSLPEIQEGVELLPEHAVLRKVLRALGTVEQVIGTSFIVVILILVLIQVGQRYIHTFGGWPWTGEIARLSLVWCTFILSGYLMSQDRHITIRMIDLVVTGKPLDVVKLMAHLIVVVTCLAMAYTTYRLIVDDIGQRTPAAELPLTWTYVLPLVGFLLTALRGILAIGLVDIPRLAHRGGPSA